MSERAELEQTHCVVSKVFAFSVPPLGSADGFKASLWPKQPIWIGRLRVVSRNDKCAVLLEHTDKEGLFASCPIQNEKTVESAIDSSRYFVLRLSDGKGRHALIGIGFNDRAQAFDFKVALQDWQNHNADPSPPPPVAAASSNYSIPAGGSIHVNFGGGAAVAKKKRNSQSGADVSQALAGMKLDAPPARAEGEKEKKKKKKKDKDAGESVASGSAEGFGNLSAASAVVGSSSAAAAAPSIIDFGFGDFDPLSTPKPAAAAAAAPAAAQSNNPFGNDMPRRASVADPFAASAAADATPFDTPFDNTPNDWVKF